MKAPQALALLTTLLVVACEKPQFDPPSAEDRLREATEAFGEISFDSIQWDDREVMLVRGASLYGTDCRDCHGTLGRGGTPYGEEHGIEVPSIVEPEWEYEDNLDAVRRRIFTGHTSGMPTHGIAGLTPREIDAVARYVLEQLRPEVLGRLGPGGV